MIIGMAGRAGAGKTTCADYLVSKGFIKDAYAKTMKEAAAVLFGVPIETLLGDITVKSKIDPFWGVSYRVLLQQFGTEACRNTFGPDFWVKVLWRRYEGLVPNLVIEDVRFPNEAEAILQRGGVVIEVLRGAPEVAQGVIHSSEIPLPGSLVTQYVVNAGSREQLYQQLDPYKEHIGK